MAARSVHELDPETIGKPSIGGSFLLHIGIIAAAAAWVFIAGFFHGSEWGNQQAPGAIEATLVSSAPALPLPQDQPPTPNVLATETPSPAPAPPQPLIAPIPPPDAIPIPEMKKPPKKEQPKKEERPSPKYAQPTKQPYRAQYGEAPATQIPRTMAPAQGPQNPITVTGGSNGFNYPWYVSGIQRDVQQAWYTQEVDPHTPTGAQTRVTFVISRDGTPSDIRISQSSGSPTLDSSALRAVQRVENFGPLPSGYSGSRLSVEYTFTYDLNAH
jgi:periplasmic protein TonB